MTTHPIDSVYVDSVSPLKSDERAYERARNALVLLTAAEIQSITVGALNMAVGLWNGFVYYYDSTDVTTAHDGNLCLVSAEGRRYKRAVMPADIDNKTHVLGLFSSGDIPVIKLAASAKTFVGTAIAGITTVALSAAQAVAIFDDYFGSTAWRTTPSVSTDSYTVDHLMDNGIKRSGSGRGVQQRTLMFKDGSVGMAGNAGATPDSGQGVTNAIARFMKIGWTDYSTTRKVVKYWVGKQSLYCIADDGKVYAQGVNLSGQLGIGSTTSAWTWTEITYFSSNGLTVTDIIPGPSGVNCFFICSNGYLYFTGYNSMGLAGDGGTVQKTTPLRVGTLTNVTNCWVGSTTNGNEDNMASAMANGTLYAWGYNNYYNLGLNNATQQNAPVSTGLTNITKVMMGIASLALNSSGSVYGCGYNGNGAPCQNTFTANTQTWTPIAGVSTANVSDIVATSGRYMCCMALLKDGTIRTWGSGGSNALGMGTGSDYATIQSPTCSLNGSITQIGAGGTATSTTVQAMYVRAGNVIQACGYNTYGNCCVGGAGAVTSFTPVRGVVGTISDWCLYDYENVYGLCVLTDKGCFNAGYSAYGSLGTHEYNLHTQTQLTPILVSGGPT